MAGATIPLVDPSFTPDAAAAMLTDGTRNTNPPYLSTFPYLGHAGGWLPVDSGTRSRPDRPHAWDGQPMDGGT